MIASRNLFLAFRPVHRTNEAGDDESLVKDHDDLLLLHKRWPVRLWVVVNILRISRR
jgi:hypothetical protein